MVPMPLRKLNHKAPHQQPALVTTWTDTMHSTPAAAAMRSTLRRLREIADV